MRYLALILLFLTSPAMAQTPEYVGKWAAEPEWCQWADRIGSRNPAPIEITETEVNGFENSCQITSVGTVFENDSWKMTLNCSSGGDTYEDWRLLMLGQPDVLWLWYRAGAPVRFTRCEGS
jgi:hypothetical protein